MSRETVGFARRAAPLLAVLGLLVSSGGGCADRARETVEASDGIVLIDLRPIPPGGGRFFSYRSAAGGHVDFLVYRESSGEARAVLDACSDCYRWRKGYRLDGDGVVCVKCGMRFRLDELRNGIGACVPLPLRAALAGDRMEIPVEALEAATKYF